MAGFLSFRGFHWEYETFGKGPELMLAFHGFGNRASDFRVFAPALEEKFTVLSFDLPFHGQSGPEPGHQQAVVTAQDLAGLSQAAAALTGHRKFSLMGYSLGGKIALQLVESIPERIDTVLLFAPDGLKVSLTNAFVARSVIGQMLYRRVMRDPVWFFRLLQLMHSAGIVDRKIHDFIRESLSTAERREMVWNVWRCFRDIRPSAQRVREAVEEHRIGLHLFFGAYDKIIPPAIGRNFVRELKQPGALHIVESGHQLVREKVCPAVAEALA
jgi:pimeloyl-ACP methyl ester carboxylesterase